MKLSSLPAAFDVLRRGRALANPGIWKAVGMGASAGTGAAALAGPFGDFAVSINAFVLGAFGRDLHLTKETGVAIGVVAAWIVGSLFHVATTDKLGVLPAKPGSAPAGQQPGPDLVQLPVRDAAAQRGAAAAAPRPAAVAGPAGDAPARSAGPAAAPLGGLPPEPGAPGSVRGWSASDLQAP